MTSERKPAESGLRVLVVDDEADIVEYLTVVLEDAGYRVAGETDPDRALRAVEQSPPDLVLLDVMMPGRTGLDLYRKIRRRAETADVPVLFISGYSREEDFARVAPPAFEAERLPPPDGYLEKPISVPELLEKIRGLAAQAGRAGRV